MAETTKKDVWAELRKPFDPKVVGKLPRGGIQLDYVGHAAVTDRLLEVDPTWTWKPLAVNEYGLPQLDADNNLWIELTVNGVTRLGVGDGRNMKERIGDALRNAAMRFGVALDLWSKEELESHLDHPENRNTKATIDPPAPEEPSVDVKADVAITKDTQAKIMNAMKMKANMKGTKEQIFEAVNSLASTIREVPNFTKLTEPEGQKLAKQIATLKPGEVEMLIPEAATEPF